MKFEAVLFDCDGVLVDSEPLTNGVLRDMLAAQGWEMTTAECMRFFVGKAVMDEVAAIEARTGRPVTDAWMAEFRTRRNQTLQDQLEAVPHIHSAVHAIHTGYAGRIACASGADRIKVEMQGLAGRLTACWTLQYCSIKGEDRRMSVAWVVAIGGKPAVVGAFGEQPVVGGAGGRHA